MYGIWSKFFFVCESKAKVKNIEKVLNASERAAKQRIITQNAYVTCKRFN